jgi:hypothetical protein
MDRASLSHAALREHPPQASPARDATRLGFALHPKDASFAAVTVAAMTGSRNPGANLCPSRRAGLRGDIFRARCRTG